MSTKKSDDVHADTTDTDEAPQPENEVEEKDRSPIGRVKVLEGQHVNLVPASDGNGGTVLVPADEPGHPDITTSPIEAAGSDEGTTRKSKTDQPDPRAQNQPMKT